MDLNIHQKKQKNNTKIKTHRKISHETKILQKISNKTIENIYRNKKINLLKEDLANKVITRTDIVNIDKIVQSWKYPMCVKCAMNCKSVSVYDLYLSSSNCHRKKHNITNRSFLLDGYGYLKATVEYINATRKIHSNEYFDAKYYVQNAIRISNRFKDKLNVCIRKLGFNMLKKINMGKYNDNSLKYFTLSELIVFSNIKTNIVNIKNTNNLELYKKNTEDL